MAKYASQAVSKRLADCEKAVTACRKELADAVTAQKRAPATSTSKDSTLDFAIKGLAVVGLIGLFPLLSMLKEKK